jgi:uncharacterized protein YggE
MHHRARLRPSALIVAATVLVTVAAGCADDDPTTDAASTTSSSDTSPTTPAAAAETLTISVSATGHAHGQPDSLTMTIGAEIISPSVSEALATLSTKLTALQGFLGDSGIPGEDIQTVWLSTYPMYGGMDNGSPTITGYQASVALNVQVNDLDTAGTLIDGATFVLGDALRLQGLAWTVADSDPLLATARADGVDRARRQAEQIAEAAGLELGELQSISENIEGGTLPYATGGGAEAEGLPLSPGTQLVTVTIRAVYTATATATATGSE